MMCGHRREISDDPEQRTADFVRDAQKAGMIMLVCVAVWLATGLGYFWPGWVVLGLGIHLAVHARSAFTTTEPDRVDA